MKNYVYKVRSEDLRFIGHMGSQSTTNWEVLARDLRTAKKIAADDFDGKITWTKEAGYYSSGDLRFVMYTIYKEKVY